MSPGIVGEVAGPGWHGRLSPAELHGTAAAALLLFQSSSEWVHRRVETVQVIDERIVRRHLSVDFTLPDDLFNLPEVLASQSQFGRVRARWRPGRSRVRLVPITWLRRYQREPRLPAGRMLFDLNDEEGRRLAFPGAAELDRITAAMLFQRAEQLLAPHGLRPGKALRDALIHIAFAIPPNLRLLRALFHPGSDEWVEFGDTDPSGRVRSERRRSALRADRLFADLTSLALRHRLVVLPLEVATSERRVIHFSYDEPVAEPLRWWRSVGQQTGWWPTIVRVPMAQAGAAEYQHVQVLAPPNVELTGVTLHATRPAVAELEPIGASPPPAPDSRDYHGTVDGPTNRAHLYLDRAGEHQLGALVLGFRAERRGLLTASLAVATLIVLILFAFARWPNQLVTQTGTATSLLLIGPGLVAAFMSRGGEHAMARLLFTFPRIMLATIAIIVVAAAAVVLALAPETHQVAQMTIVHGVRRWTITAVTAPVAAGLTITLWVLAGIGGALGAGMWLSRALPRPARER